MLGNSAVLWRPPQVSAVGEKEMESNPKKRRLEEASLSLSVNARLETIDDSCEKISGIYFFTLYFLFNIRFKTRSNHNKNSVRTESLFSIYFLAEFFDPADLNRFGIRLLKVFLCLGVKFWIYFLITSWVHTFLSIGIMFWGI